MHVIWQGRHSCYYSNIGYVSSWQQVHQRAPTSHVQRLADTDAVLSELGGVFVLVMLA